MPLFTPSTASLVWNPYAHGALLLLRGGEGVFVAAGGAASLHTDDVVGGWEDQSGNAHHAAQGTTNLKGLFKPRYFAGQSAMCMDGTGRLLSNATLPFAGLSKFTLFLAYGNTGNGIPLSLGAGNVNVARVGGTNYVNVPGGYVTFPNLWTAPQLLTLRFDAAGATNTDKVKVWRSGQPVTLTFPTAVGTATSGTGYDVGQTVGAPYYLTGPIFDAQLIPDALSAADTAIAHASFAAGTFGGVRKSLRCVGDSLTGGYPINGSGGTIWAATMGKLLPTWEVSTDPVGLLYAEVGADIARVAQLATAHAVPERQAYRAKDVMLIWAGVNDLPNAAAATSFAALMTFVDSVTAEGFLVGLVTIPDRKDVGDHATFASRRATFNTSLRGLTTGGSGRIYFLVDLDGTPLESGPANNDSYGSGDSVHWSQVGNDYFATNVLYPAMQTAGVI